MARQNFLRPKRYDAVVQWLRYSAAPKLDMVLQKRERAITQ